MRLSELAELETIRAHAAASSPYHTATALQRGAQAAREARALRAEVADLRAQLAADQLELARLRALEGL